VVQATRWMTRLARLGTRAADWWRRQSVATRQWFVRGFVGLAALTVIAGALWVTGDTSHEFESLPDAYESLGSVGVDCQAPARTDVTTGRERTLCLASDGSLAVLQLSDSLPDAQAAVGDAHADSEAVLRYAQIAKQTPFVPRPVLLGDNWTLVANTTVLERVAEEYGGTIYPYPETPPAG
jgi:hypothetical protein